MFGGINLIVVNINHGYSIVDYFLVDKSSIEGQCYIKVSIHMSINNEYMMWDY